MFLISELLSLRLNNDTKVTHFGSEKQIIPANGVALPVNGELRRINKIAISILFFAGNFHR
jgi:hypothetical protein